MNFKVGDRVRAKSLEGTIIEIKNENDIVSVGYSTNGGGCLQFKSNELELVPRVATLKAFKSVHGTVDVIIQNCSSEVATLLWRFDIWNSNGRFEYDKPKEKAKILFECPMEFLGFIKSDMGRIAFERMGVKEFHIEDGDGSC